MRSTSRHNLVCLIVVLHISGDGNCEMLNCANLKKGNCVKHQHCCWDNLQCWAVGTIRNPNNTCEDTNELNCSSLKVAKDRFKIIKATELDSYPIGSNVSIKCVGQYYSDDSHNSITCAASQQPYSYNEDTQNCRCGQWTDVASCKLGCLRLDDSVNAKVSGYSHSEVNPGLYKQGTEALIHCQNSTYRTSGSRVICNRHGKWTNSPPSCLVGCSILIPPTNSRVSESRVTVVNQMVTNGSWVTISCQTGFHSWSLNTANTRLTCLYGTWIGSRLKCERGCLLITGHTGIVQYDGSETWKDVYAEGTVAKSGCQGISGDVVVTFICDKGRWIGDDNQCHRNYTCPVQHSVYSKCQLFGDRKCNPLLDKDLRTCDVCCELTYAQYDLMCNSIGCFCKEIDASTPRKSTISCTHESDQDNKWLSYLVDKWIWLTKSGYDKRLSDQIRKESEIFFGRNADFFVFIGESDAYSHTTVLTEHLPKGRLCEFNRRSKSGLFGSIEHSNLTSQTPTALTKEKCQLLALDPVAVQHYGNELKRSRKFQPLFNAVEQKVREKPQISQNSSFFLMAGHNKKSTVVVSGDIGFANCSYKIGGFNVQFLLYR